MKQSFCQKSVLSSLYNLIIESKNFFEKSFLFWYAIRECLIRSNNKVAFGHNAFISSLAYLIKESKTSFAKVVQLGMLYENVI